jgi:hypothetical protein
VTEEEWLAATDPIPMLSVCVHGGAIERGYRLWAVGCTRRIWPLVNSKWLRECILAAEQFADGDIPADVVEDHSRRAWDFYHGGAVVGSSLALRDAAAAVGCCLCTRPPMPAVGGYVLCALEVATRATERDAAVRAEMVAQANLLRCVFGNPFRPVAADPAWFTSTAVSLAAGIYTDRAFDRLPILADALQDAGCDNADLLDHCRGPGPHARGCWVVDLILGTE